MANSPHLRELVLQHPAIRSSRGRNGPLTARRLQVYARTGNSPDDRGFLAIDAWSGREAKEAPIVLGLSLEDAVVLADEILAAVRTVTGTPEPAGCRHCGNNLSYIPLGTADEHCARCGEPWEEAHAADATP